MCKLKTNWNLNILLYLLAILCMYTTIIPIKTFLMQKMFLFKLIKINIRIEMYIVCTLLHCTVHGLYKKKKQK